MAEQFYRLVYTAVPRVFRTKIADFFSYSSTLKMEAMFFRNIS
jgi:hypothetical protein